MPLPRKFVWIGEVDDRKRSHLLLEPQKVYPSSSIGDSLLLKWMEEGLLLFVEDNPAEAIPPDVVLKVQKGTIPMKDLLDRIDRGLGLKKEN